MCNRYHPSRLDKMALAEELREMGIYVDWRDIDDDGDFFKDGSAYPRYRTPIMRQVDDEKYLLEYRQWGLLPRNFDPKQTDPKKQGIAIRKQQNNWGVNARHDALRKWPWKDIYQHQRCVLLAESFYEPDRDVPKDFVRYSITDMPFFYLAGLWNDWTCSLCGHTYETFVMVTTKAGFQVARTRGGTRRDRAPVAFTHPEEVKQYLSLEVVEYGHLAPLLSKNADELLECERVPRG